MSSSTRKALRHLEAGVFAMPMDGPSVHRHCSKAHTVLAPENEDLESDAAEMRADGNRLPPWTLYLDG